MTIENRGFNQFWISENNVTFAVGIAEAARILNCTVEEARKVTFATLEALEVTQ